MISQYICIGDKVEICFIREKKTYISKIESILDSNKFAVRPPISSHKIILLPVNEVCSLVFSSQKGRFVGNAKVIEHKELDGVLCSFFECSSQLEKIQMREFFRFQCLLPLKFTQTSVSNGGPVQMFNGIIKDLSGGGMRFITNEDLEPNSTISCAFILDKDYILTSSKILRKQSLTDGNYKFEYRVMFTDISKTDQDIIIQFIFNAQRKVLQKSKSNKM